MEKHLKKFEKEAEPSFMPDSTEDIPRAWRGKAFEITNLGGGPSTHLHMHRGPTKGCCYHNCSSIAALSSLAISSPIFLTYRHTYHG